MIDIILTITGFLLGTHLTITLFAACYRLLDLAYRLPEFILKILAAIALQVTLITLVYLLITGPFVSAFLAGQIFFATFHVVAFWLGRLIIAVTLRDINRQSGPI